MDARLVLGGIVDHICKLGLGSIKGWLEGQRGNEEGREIPEASRDPWPPEIHGLRRRRKRDRRWKRSWRGTREGGVDDGREWERRKGRVYRFVVLREVRGWLSCPAPLSARVLPAVPIPRFLGSWPASTSFNSPPLINSSLAPAASPGNEKTTPLDLAVDRCVVISHALSPAWSSPCCRSPSSQPAAQFEIPTLEARTDTLLDVLTDSECRQSPGSSR